MTTKEEEEQKRKKINDDILKRLKAGENLQDNASKTWFPPRPINQKDPEAVKKIYGENAKIVGPKQVQLKVVGENEDGRETKEIKGRDQKDEGGGGVGTGTT